MQLRKSTLCYFREIRNVVGYIHGSDDPDHYVILGNHYDAWVYGALDPNSGTATLAEVARAMVQTMNETNWRPGKFMDILDNAGLNK